MEAFAFSDSLLCLGGTCPVFLGSVKACETHVEYFVQSKECRELHDLTGHPLAGQPRTFFRRHSGSCSQTHMSRTPLASALLRFQGQIEKSCHQVIKRLLALLECDDNHFHYHERTPVHLRNNSRYWSGSMTLHQTNTVASAVSWTRRRHRRRCSRLTNMSSCSSTTPRSPEASRSVRVNSRRNIWRR